ncbi:MAG: hypothetical protein HYR64_10210 [Fimbriimonas ginsengisoli]|uniref:Uncharacterized protein n=1 Tax=Fimbriimonas ginsengisoli TaxID=1005039 RepID=A0A931LZ71_FIMGI|nr:hypothetical protein [Fimbriimonas ginsengisoli]
MVTELSVAKGRALIRKRHRLIALLLALLLANGVLLWWIAVGKDAWKGEYRRSYARIGAVLADGERLLDPSEGATFEFQMHLCEGVIDRSRRLKDEVSALATPNDQAVEAKSRLLQLLETNAECAQLANDASYARMKVRASFDACQQLCEDNGMDALGVMALNDVVHKQSHKEDPLQLLSPVEMDRLLTWSKLPPWLKHRLDDLWLESKRVDDKKEECEAKLVILHRLEFDYKTRVGLDTGS